MLSLDLQTVDLQSDGRVARIVLNRPDALNAWTCELGQELLSALDHAAEDPEIRAIVHHRRRPSVLLRRRPEGRRRVRRPGPPGRPHPSARDLQPADPPRPDGPQAGDRSRQRAGGRHRLLARARRRPRARGGVGLLPDGVRQHRPRPRRRRLADAARPGRSHAGVRDGLPRRARAGGAGRRVGSRQPGAARRGADRRGRCSSPPGWQPDLPGPSRRSSGRSTPGRTRDSTNCSISRRSCSRSRAESKDFLEGVMAFMQKRPAEFTGE